MSLRSYVYVGGGWFVRGQGESLGCRRKEGRRSRDKGKEKKKKRHLCWLAQSDFSQQAGV